MATAAGRAAVPCRYWRCSPEPSPGPSPSATALPLMPVTLLLAGCTLDASVLTRSDASWTGPL
ncbi:hypothetical protein [Streptomyces fuscichromogenes]|uniref:hypothetical protein n=1 Tax=Streptomyces fuscichromogenes TaxID=1324013 RepID=UPI0016704A17|nr:hypothetical protein [Streptomyces fuscichromogenes]